MSENERDETETTDRYVIEVGTHDRVFVVDTKTEATVKVFAGPDRLLNAVGYAAELNQHETRTPHVQSAAVTSSIPGRMDDSRREARRAAEQEPVHHTLASLTRTPAAFLADTLPALARRQRLESMLTEVRDVEKKAREILLADRGILRCATDLRKRLETALSATQSAETAEVVGRDTPESSVGLSSAAWAEAGGLPRMFKPGPY